MYSEPTPEFKTRLRIEVLPQDRGCDGGFFRQLAKNPQAGFGLAQPAGNEQNVARSRAGAQDGFSAANLADDGGVDQDLFIARGVPANQGAAETTGSST